MHYCSDKACVILSNKQKPTNKLRKHQELVNSDSLFNVQDIWEREEAKALVFIKDNDEPFLQKESNGLWPAICYSFSLPLLS